MFVGRGFGHNVSALNSSGVLTPEARKCHFPAAEALILRLSHLLLNAAGKMPALPELCATLMNLPIGPCYTSTPIRHLLEILFHYKRRNPLTYYGGPELAASFRTVRKNTITIAQDIPEEKYSFRAAPDTRSVGDLLTHIALSYNFQYQVHAKEKRTTLAGFDFPSLMQRMKAEEQIPRAKDQIIELLRTDGEIWAGWVEGLPESFLAESILMPPGAPQTSRTRFDMILSVKEHEMQWTFPIF